MYYILSKNHFLLDELQNVSISMYCNLPVETKYQLIDYDPCYKVFRVYSCLGMSMFTEESR